MTYPDCRANERTVTFDEHDLIDVLENRQLHVLSFELCIHFYISKEKVCYDLLNICFVEEGFVPEVFLNRTNRGGRFCISKFINLVENSYSFQIS